MADVHLADTGTRFELTIQADGIALDISTATVKTIKFQKPDNVRVSKIADFTTDGTDGKIDYITITDDIDVKGEWKIQGFINMPSGVFHTSKATFGVSGNL